MDARLTEAEENEILHVIKLFQGRYIEFHDFRTRRSGPEEYVDFHLVIPSKMSVATAHQLCDEIELAIQGIFERAQVLIHIEPEHEQLANKPVLHEG